MITDRLLSLSHEVVKNALLPNKKLRAKAGTPLEYIVSSILPKEAQISQEGINHALSCVAERCEQPFSVTGDKVLYNVLDTIDEQYISNLKQQLAFVRNTVNPVIMETIEKVEHSLAQLDKPVQPFTVNCLNIPDFIYGQLREYITQAGVNLNANQSGPEFKPNLNLDEVSVVELCKTEFDDINQGILQLADDYTEVTGSHLFKDVIDCYFTVPNHSVAGIQVTYKSFAQAIVAFLIADNLMKNPLPQMGLNSDQLNVWGVFFKSACSRVVQVYLNLFTGAVSSKTLIQHVDKDKKQMTVYGPVYDEMEPSTRADVLMGIFHTENPYLYRTLNSIAENTEALINRGKIATDLSIRTDDNRKVARYTDVIQGAIISLVEETKNSEETSELRDFIDVNKPAFEYRPVVIEFLRNRYPGVALVKHDIRMVVSDTICHCFFQNTMASVLLNRFIQTEIHHPEATQSSIISTALIELLIEWVAGQIELVDQ